MTNDRNDMVSLLLSFMVEDISELKLNCEMSILQKNNLLLILNILILKYQPIQDGHHTHNRQAKESVGVSFRVGRVMFHCRCTVRPIFWSRGKDEQQVGQCQAT